MRIAVICFCGFGNIFYAFKKFMPAILHDVVAGSSSQLDIAVEGWDFLYIAAVGFWVLVVEMC